MKKLLGKILCKLGIHKKQYATRHGQVNWIITTVEIEICTRCNKIF